MIKNVLGSVVLAGALLFGNTASAQDQAAKDEQVMKDYFAKNHIKATKAPTGLYYVIKKKGSGENAKVGQKVSVNYLGRFLDGNTFDGSVDADFKQVNGRTPYTFTLGTGQVIRGWDEGIKLLNPGTRATLYLPSAMAYGSSGNGRIPANTVLMFDVELVSAQ